MIEKINKIAESIRAGFNKLDSLIQTILFMCGIFFAVFIFFSILNSFIRTDYKGECKEYAKLFELEYEYLKGGYSGECYLRYEDEWITKREHEVKR